MRNTIFKLAFIPILLGLYSAFLKLAIPPKTTHFFVPIDAYINSFAIRFALFKSAFICP